MSIRVLHLIDKGCGDVGVLMCELACRIGAARHDVVVIGDDAFERRVWGLGVESTDRVPDRGSTTVGAASGLKRWMNDRRSAGVAFDLVQCWSWGTLALAERCGVEAARIGVIDRAWESSERPDAIGNPLGPGGPVLAVFDHHTAAMLATRIGGDVRRVGTNVRVLTPPVFPVHARTLAERAAGRAELGIDAGDVVVQLLADPPGLADAFRFAFFMGLTCTAGQRLVGLMPRGTSESKRGLRFVLAHGGKWPVIEHDEPLTWTLGLADLALWDQSAGIASIGLAAAMGLPVVMGNSESVREVVRGGGAAELVATNDMVGGLVPPILRLLDHPGRLAAVGQTLRQAWLSREGKFEDDLLALWQERVNVPVARAGLPIPTALAAST